jgi:prepilin-type N-terminal cleavage/methylation domain-containing protein
MKTDEEKTNGFTLLEMMTVVGIIGLTLVMAIPSYMKMRKESSISEFVNTLHAIHDSFQEYAIMNRGYPPGMVQGKTPPAMTNGPYFLPKGFDWTKSTPLGGAWKWDAQMKSLCNLTYEDGIVVMDKNGSPPLALDDFFLRVDQQIDDGNLSTGMFRRRTFGGVSGFDGYVYVLQEDPNKPWGIR